MAIAAIDISKHNGSIDFRKVKASNHDINTVIIRTGYGKYSQGQIDKMFFENYDKAKAIGMYVGAYHYSYAKNSREAEEEAYAMLKIIGNRKFELPLFYDIEESVQAKLSKTVCSDMVRTFCNTLENNGKWAGVYSYDSFFGSNLEDSIVARYSTWVAKVGGKEPKICKRYDIWQYSWTGKIDGIKGDVDMNYIYRDYPQTIQKAHLNGY